MNDIYTRIESLCRARDIDITSMCKQANVSRAVLSEFKMGRTKKLSTSTLSKISDFFGVTVDYLIGRTDYPNMEVFQRTPNEITTYQKKGAAPFKEQLPEDRQKLFDEIMNLNEEDFQTAKELLDVIIRRRGNDTP